MPLLGKQVLVDVLRMMMIETAHTAITLGASYARRLRSSAFMSHLFFGADWSYFFVIDTSMRLENDARIKRRALIDGLI